MKTRTSMLLLMILVVAIVLIASRDKEEELYGTWVNSDYNASAEIAKLIVDPDPGIRDDANGTVIRYLRGSDKQPYTRFSFRIEETWNDDEGNIWYKIEALVEMEYYHLWKISNSGNTLELVFTRQNYPDEIDSNHANYRIFRSNFDKINH